MVDLLVVNPMAAHGIYGPLGEELVAVEPPLWCRLIAGSARDKGHEVAILDAEALGLCAEKAAEWVAAQDPRLCCIAVYGHQPSASTQQMWGAGLLANELRQRWDGEVIMVGGHPSALPRRTLEEEPVNFVGVGEGPETVEALLEGKPLAIVPGLAYMPDGKGVRINPPAPLIENLHKLHGHAWDLLPMERYRAHNWHCFGGMGREPYASTYTSLGCPYKCTFCCINAPFHSNRYRMRPPEAVVDELEYLYEEHGIQNVKITDEMFVLNEHHYGSICHELIERGLGQHLNLWAYARVDTVKPRNLYLLRQAGIRWLALGIESGSAHVRNGAAKALRTDDIVGTVRAIQREGINVIGNFMFGLRDDDLSTMWQTVDLAIECLPDFANFYATMAYPGSALYGQAIKEGWALPDSWRGYSQHNDDCRPLDTEHVSGREVLRFRDEAFTHFFTHPLYRAHVYEKFGQETLEQVDRMVRYKLKRKLLQAEPAC
jgi:anaerobic magnesium-protoporphyrin IX monomethyl ester cyclase